MLVAKKVSRDLYSSENIVQSRVMSKENTNVDHRIENHILPWNKTNTICIGLPLGILGEPLKNLQIPRLRLVIYKLFLAFSENLLRKCGSLLQYAFQFILTIVTVTTFSYNV